MNARNSARIRKLLPLGLVLVAALAAPAPAQAIGGRWLGFPFGADSVSPGLTRVQLGGPLVGLPSGLFFTTFHVNDFTGGVTVGSWVFVIFQDNQMVGFLSGQVLTFQNGVFSTAVPPNLVLNLLVNPFGSFGGPFTLASGSGQVLAQVPLGFGGAANGIVNLNVVPSAFAFPP